jgi:hypothetical protein
MGRVEVFNCLQLQSTVVNLTAEGDQFVHGPQLFRIAGAPPTQVGAGGLVIARIVFAAVEIVDEVGHDVRSSGLSRELKIRARQHVPI